MPSRVFLSSQPNPSAATSHSAFIQSPQYPNSFKVTPRDLSGMDAYSLDVESLAVVSRGGAYLLTGLSAVLLGFAGRAVVKAVLSRIQNRTKNG